ncbi:HNH endonuclease [Stenotrophomonas sp. 364]|nr:HNH endonuclease [Stenotrophomonas sp. 364]
MQLRSANGRSFNKALIYRELAELHGRTPKAWEYRMQNISHVLDQLQQPWLAGLRPAANVGPEVTGRLLKLLSGAPAPSSYTATSGTTRNQLQLERRIAEESLAFSTYDAEDQRQKVIATIVRRQGQGAFRSALLQAYSGRCAMTRSSVVDVLEAAHVHPYRGAATNVLSNGLLLRADVHTLFDLYLISVEPKSRLLQAAPSLLATEYGNLDGLRLAEPAERRHAVGADLLEWHRSQCEW